MRETVVFGAGEYAAREAAEETNMTCLPAAGGGGGGGKLPGQPWPVPPAPPSPDGGPRCGV